ncbi:hypothetical protein D4L85_19280 [Chryseolinea soli]|uniref:Uncharacterized protein n=1 Tax=Chryseolinea soli TaxID=2321403 RepID=A0A385SPX6_9BACT|nr:hypothetical protein D4L85_19280 [Chryseolinea soli]
MSGTKVKKRRGDAPEGDVPKINVPQWVWDRNNDPNAKKRMETAKKIIAVHGLPKGRDGKAS